VTLQTSNAKLLLTPTLHLPLCRRSLVVWCESSYVCTLCFDNRPLFISEHRLFSQKQLDKHLRSLPGAMTAAGGDKTGGHPLCTFCGSNFFDACEEL